MKQRTLRIASAIFAFVAVGMLVTGTALADPQPRFQHGFATLAAKIPDVVGEPLENERPGEAGTIVQQTSQGLMVWSETDNVPRFTDGQSTWVYGSHEVRKRLNAERLPWENDVVVTNGASTLFQLSTINALMEGLYDGTLTFGQLKEKGDFGIGTFHTLDGEMAEVDGKVYRIRSDGKVYPVDDAERTPFASVTFFQPTIDATIDAPKAWVELYPLLDSLYPSKNLPYAIKVEGEFQYVKSRSVPPQVKPYPRLVDVTATQPTFEFHQVKGTLVGFRMPDFMEGLNVPGYHFHFLTEDRSAGGHLLEASLQKARVQIQPLLNFNMELPGSDDFYRLRLDGGSTDELDKVER